MRLVTSRAFAGHRAEHVKRGGLAGLSNGELRSRVLGTYDLLVTTDADFKSRPELAPTAVMGTLCIRIVPNVVEKIEPALLAFSAAVDLSELVGRLTILWRDRWEIRPALSSGE